MEQLFSKQQRSHPKIGPLDVMKNKQAVIANKGGSLYVLQANAIQDYLQHTIINMSCCM